MKLSKRQCFGHDGSTGHLVARDSAARHHERLGGKAKMEILEVDLFLSRLLAKCWGVLSHAEINGGFVAVGGTWRVEP